MRDVRIARSAGVWRAQEICVKTDAASSGISVVRAGQAVSHVITAEFAGLKILRIVAQVTLGAFNLGFSSVESAVDAIWNSVGTGCADVRVEIKMCITGFACGWDCAGGAKWSGAVGFGLKQVGSSLAVDKAKQESQNEEYVEDHMNIIQ